MDVEITRINPEELHETAGYHHVTVVRGGRLVFLAGQCPVARDGTVVGIDDIEAQVDQTAANALIALTAAGAKPEHVVRSVLYVVSDDGEFLRKAWRRFHETPIAAAFTTASTLLGVTRLGFTGQLVELDLTAAIPD